MNESLFIDSTYTRKYTQHLVHLDPGWALTEFSLNLLSPNQVEKLQIIQFKCLISV